MLRAALSFVLVLVSAMAEPPKKGKALQKAHEHGSAMINIAVDGKTAVVEFEAPSEGIFGFEHQARTAAQKKLQEAGLATLRTRIGSMVVFDPAVACRFTVRKAVVEQEAGEDHSEVQAEFDVACNQPLAGSRIRFGVTAVFPRLREVKVQVLNGAQQTGLTVTSDRGTIELSK